MANINPFYEEQPPLLFIDELKSPVHQTKPDWFNRTEKEADEADVHGIYIVNNFPDNENLLQTAKDDFTLFSKIYEIGGNEYPVYLEYGKTSKFEEYKINVKEDACTITAEDTEGIRRGIIYIEDELHRREGAFLPLGEIVRTPRIKARITKGFFSPTNRPPKNIDELMNDVDYYPDEYLNRLAHDGSNGLYIYTRLTDLVKTDYLPEYGVDAQKRIDKFNKIIARCKRYGIGVYVFFIDPAFLPEDIAKKHPDIAGVKMGNIYSFCTHSEKGRAYCIEAIEKLCRAIPDMAGIINVSYGERVTTCASTDHTQCPNCKDYSKAEIVAYTANLMKEGMRRAGSKADFISWTYGYRFWSEDTTREFVHNCDEDVIILDSFEEMGSNNQLGKDRLAVDYWLAYRGPSDIYKAAADTALCENKKMYAKMQVCCSHEVATVPYVPVPGILFDKFSANFQGVMECWYFGNYPSLMSKAAGELAFLHDFSDKETFLKSLSAIYCGRSNAESLAKAFRFFEEGYSKYPTNIMFSYYGPMHDGVCWELKLEPENKSLPRTWLFLDTPDGDRICECMRSGHSIDEVVTLLSEMKENWVKGMGYIPHTTPVEMQNVTAALSCLIESSNNIMNFYDLRFKLNEAEDKISILSQMADLVKAEIRNSKAMIEICKNDTRLGYHSEAESFKFFPAQIEKRIKVLENLLETEFKTVKSRIDNGKQPLNWDVKYGKKSYKLATSEADAKSEQISTEEAYFKAWTDEENLYINLEGKKGTFYFIGFENEPMNPTSDIFFHNGERRIDDVYTGLSGKRKEEYLATYNYSFKQTEEKDIYNITIKKDDININDIHPIRFRVSANNKQWCAPEKVIYRLGLCLLPEEYGVLER